MKAIGTIFVLALTTTAIGACGTGGAKTHSTTAASSPSPPTTAALIAAADPICAQVNAAISAHPVTKLQDLPRIAEILGPAEREGAERLAALTPPHVLAGEWKRFVADALVVAEDTQKMTQWGKLHDGARERALLGAGGNARRELREIAARRGFSECSHLD